MKYCFIFIRMAITKTKQMKKPENKSLWGCGEITIFVHCWWECGKRYGNSSKKLKIQLPYNPAIPLLGIYLRDLKAGIQPHICSILMFTAVLFTTGQKVQTTQVSINRWMDKQNVVCSWGFPGGSEVKNLPAYAGDPSWIPGSGRSPPLEKWQPTPKQPTLAWEIPWTEEPSGLQSMESQKSNTA